MKIRRANHEEIPAAVALARESFMAAVAPHYGEQGIGAFMEFAAVEAMSRRVAENYIVYVAYQDEDLVGMAAVRDGFHLAMLFVSPQAQRKGVGRMLLDTVLSNCTKDLITVNASPNSKDAYVRFGFAPTSEEKVTNGIKFVPMVMKRNGPNKSPEPTPTAVTPRATESNPDR